MFFSKRIIAFAIVMIIMHGIFEVLGAERHINHFSCGNEDVAKIAITIDDWYSRELLPEFLDTANEYNCKLTFYPVGVNLLPEDRELWLRVINEGHEIGNHSNTHINLEKASRDRIVRQLEKMEKRLVECIGQDYELNTVRFPFGAGRHKGTKSSFAKAIKDAGYIHAIFWNVDTTDADEILRKTKNGSIILLHSNNKDLRAFKKILPVFQERGFEMVTVSELLGLTKTSPLPPND